MDEYILTVLKNKNLLDEITFFTDDPIDAFKRMFNTYLEYNLTHKGTYTIILSLYVENGENKVLSKLINRPKKEEKKMKKKIRDLSTEECKKICDGRDCMECPFIHVLCSPESPNSWIHHQELYSDLFLDQKEELKDENNK